MSTPIVILPRPVWVRMPADDEPEYHTGLKRGKLYLLCVPCSANRMKPKVRSISVLEDDADQIDPSPKKRGSKKRAVRLIHLDSLLAHLSKLDESQNLQEAA